MAKKILLVLLINILFSGCFNQNTDDTIKIGIAVGLTGKYSSLSLDEKNGIILAFDKIDYQIKSKKIDLIFKDDKQDEETDKKVINDLINNNVKIIIGNATSSMSKISLDIVSKHDDVLLLSPSASSSYFSNKDDNFFRVQPANSLEQFSNVIKLLKDNDAKHIYLVGDKKNKAYLDDYLRLFDEDEELKYEGIIDSSLPYEEILKKVEKADFIVQVQNSIDSASLIQYLRINKIKTKVISSGWAKHKDFLENAGKWANGIYFISSDYIDSENKSYQEFVKDFYNLFKNKPNISNIQGYQAAQVIIQALQKGHEKIDDIKKFIIEKKTFNIAGKDVSFNKYGDITTPFHLFEVKDNQFKKIK